MIDSTQPQALRAATSPVAARTARRRRRAGRATPYLFLLRTLGPRYDFKFHLLAGLERLEPIRLNCREVHEDIFAAILFDETVTLGIVEPFYLT